MPGSLQGFTWLGLISGSLMIIVSLLPGWEDEEGNRISTHELWSTGIGPEVVGWGIAFICVAVAFLYAWRPIRQILSALALGDSVYLLCFPDPEVPLLWLWPLIWFGILIWYFFFKKTVVSYFQKTMAQSTTANPPL